MIKAFFRFKKDPFAKDIDHKHIFMSNSMKEVFSRLDYMKQNRGLMLLTGEPGTGKTLAIRTFIEKLNPNFNKAGPISWVLSFHNNVNKISEIQPAV